jgi:hypothetical protein
MYFSKLDNYHTIASLIEDYFTFLRDKTIVQNVQDSWVQISTPLPDVFNDSIDLYVKLQDEKILISDDG